VLLPSNKLIGRKLIPHTQHSYLPGRELWDECRIEILSNKLTELGYPTKIVKPSNPLLNFNLTDEEEEERDLVRDPPSLNKLALPLAICSTTKLPPPHHSPLTAHTA
jgi:hypothetical protein